MNLSEKATSINPSPTLAVDAKAKQMKLEGHDIIGFGAGEPDYDTPEYIKKAAISAINEGFTKYTAVGGIIELKNAISRYLQESTGITYNSNEIMVSNGAKHCLYNALFCLINPGDKVLIPSPYWVSFPEMVKLCGGIPVFVPTSSETGFMLKARDIKPYIDSDTKVLIINSPNNPTGSVYGKEDLESIAQLAIDHDINVVADEIYDKLVYDGEKHNNIVSLNKEMKNRTLVINGVSKTFSMTGWRIGFAAGPENLIKAMTNLQSHSSSNPNSIAQKASLEAVNNPLKDQVITQMVYEFSKRRDYIVERINSIPNISCPLPKGAFYVFVNISKTFSKKIDGMEIKDSISFASLLLEKFKVAVVPGIAFGADEYIRLSYATSIDNIRYGLDRIELFVNKLK
jgi:aspartate aminotransferase